jgi:hypothetical protein
MYKKSEDHKQLCQRTLLGQTLSNNMVNIYNNMQIIAFALIANIITNKIPKKIHFSAF